MKLTTKVHYSVKALLDLTLQPNFGPASVRSIAMRQQLPTPYLEKLLIQLRQADIVRAYRGTSGGYQLAKAPEDITLEQIFLALEETMEPLTPPDSSDTQATDWVTQSVWRQLQQKFNQALYSITLAELYFDARSWQAAQGQETQFIV